jgi:hypothetical protein
MGHPYKGQNPTSDYGNRAQSLKGLYTVHGPGVGTTACWTASILAYMIEQQSPTSLKDVLVKSR